MNSKDLKYYRGRIAEEKLAARSATSRAAARTHDQLVEEYVSLIEANGESVSEPAHTH